MSPHRRQSAWCPASCVARLRALHRQLQNLVEERGRFVRWMQQALDQMNVQVHRAVSDLTGKTGLGIVRAIVGGERDPLRLADLREGRCKKRAEEFVAYLTGTWRDEHLYNLEGALALYDAGQERIEAYERRLEGELKAQACEELRERDLPEHPSQGKGPAFARGAGRTDHAVPFRGVRPDADRRHRRGGVADDPHRGRPGPGSLPLRKALRQLAAPSTPHSDLGRQATAKEEAGQWQGSHAHRRRAAHGLRVAAAVPVGSRRRVPAQGAAQRHVGRHFLHRAQARDPGLPHAALGTRLRRHRRGRLPNPVPQPDSRQPRCKREDSRLQLGIPKRYRSTKQLTISRNFITRFDLFHLSYLSDFPGPPQKDHQ